MANASIKSAFERMWHHITLALAEKANSSDVESELASKASAIHGHKVGEISDLTATASELNYVSGATSNIQSQLNNMATVSYVNEAIGDAIGGSY